MNAIFFSLLMAALLCSINVVSSLAFNAATSLVVTSTWMAYLTAICCLVHRRLFGLPLPPARWSLGRWGLPINLISIVFLVITFFCSIVPTTKPVSVSNFNWGAVVLGIIIIVAVVLFSLAGKRTYQGPVKLIKKM